MSKFVKTALSVALVLIVLGACLIAGWMLRGGSWVELWENDSFSVSVGDLGVGAGYTVCVSGEESFSPAEVQRLDISWIAGSVKLESGNVDSIRLSEKAERALSESEQLRWKLENGTLSLSYCANGARNVPKKDLTLTVPADWSAQWISVDATSASLELRGLTVRERLEAGATSGSVTLLGCVCRRLEASSTSGSIAVRCEAEEISLGATSGSIRCEDVPPLCDVDIGTTSGTVKLSLRDTENEQRIRIDVTSGNVYLDVPGAIDLDYDSTSGRLRGSLTQGGSGCPRVEVDATSGDLILGKFE